MTKSFTAAVTKRLQAQIQTRQSHLKDQLKAVTAFPKELQRALPVYEELCAMSSAIPCTMGEGGYLVIDDIGHRGRKEFDAAQDTVNSMIVSVVIYIERLWSTGFGSRDNDAADKFWDVCREFYELSGVDGDWHARSPGKDSASRQGTDQQLEARARQSEARRGPIQAVVECLLESTP
jgi:hypothetical protein